MAIVRKLSFQPLETASKHTETHGTYALVTDENGTKYLQIDTYGSAERKLEGKKSQSIRLAEEAARQLAQIIEKHFPAKA